jgi:electron transfer flavoprotein alpha subunit
MNCIEFDSAFTGTQPLKVVRARWGGSLLEQSEVDAQIKLVTLANHTVEAVESSVSASNTVHEVELNDSVMHSFVQDRVERVAGVTLATSPVVVSGGRGVGSAEAFAPLEELAGLLGGVVGCSRAVTNNGWRNHTDQVGQTGTRIAPDIYIACGISGAIQHWVGAMASKNILAINTDKEANIVTKAGYAVIGDLHKIVPAISEEIRRRRG